MELDLMTELKNLKSSLENSLDDKIEKAISPIQIDAQKNQRAFDKLFKAKDIDLTGGNQLLQDELQKGYETNYDSIQKMLRGEGGNKVGFNISTKAITTISSSGIGGTANVIASSPGGIVDLGTRKTHIRDLIPIGTMTGSRFPYLVESAMVGAPNTVAEGALKPEVELRLSEVIAESQYIAAWTNLSKKLLEDVPNLPGFLNQRLLEALLVAEDTQLINGNGTSPNLRGLNSAGAHTVATSAAPVDDMLQLLDGVAQLAANNRNGSVIILSVSDYFRLVGAQTENSGLKVVNVNSNGDLSILGVRIAWNQAVSTGTYFVIDRDGVVLLFREAPRVEFFYESVDNVRRNAVDIRVEERVAFATNSSFVIRGQF